MKASVHDLPQLTGKMLGPLIVEDFLGYGTQGTVFKVLDGKGQSWAVKWHHVGREAETQKNILERLIKRGPPRGVAGRRFVWPVDMVVSSPVGEDQGAFGYAMPLVGPHFATLQEVQARLKPRPTYNHLCRISCKIATSFRALHLEGFCYRDISCNNVLFEPSTGEVLIFDCDNIGIDRASEALVWGTPGYMAPELARGEQDPSTLTDLHSLAVLLFELWTWNHPLHGQRYAKIRCWDLPAQALLYAEEPIFIFNPKDNRNRLPDGDPVYEGVRRVWEQFPKDLRQLFIQAFVDGLHSPAQRVTEGVWERAFSRLADMLFHCSSCYAENFWHETTPQSCWNCKVHIMPPPSLSNLNRPDLKVLLSSNKEIWQRHVDHRLDSYSEEVPIGQVVQNPSRPDIFGIRNLTNQDWLAMFPNGTAQPIPPGRAVPLNPGTKILIRGETVQIERQPSKRK